MDNTNVYKNMLNQLTQKNSVDLVRPVSGDNIFRVIPSKGIWAIEVKKHFTPSGCFVCGKTVGQHCTFCEEVSASTDDKFRMDRCAKLFFWASIYDFLTNCIRIVELKKKVIIGMLNILADPDTSDSLDLQKGRSFKVNKSGTGIMNTDYLVTIQMKTSPITKKLELVDLHEEVRKLWEIGQNRLKMNSIQNTPPKQVTEITAETPTEEQAKLLKDIEDVF
jgi:hypothetical protein